ncbi:MAG: class I SAM-dependent methyltransferase [Planctomycetes bacterium]|nr:class I SAM-dependent methyltransferase [Planctomycetota bacterium]
MLFISENEIRAAGPGGILGVCWRQWRVERALARRGIRFRATTPDKVAAAYAAMSQDEFDAINGPQDWANWRTIPRALSGHVPDEPLRVLDLGCGTGSSTCVLAHYCPAGSRITGYEIAEPMLTFANRRAYRHRDGDAVAVDFVCQGVTEPFRQFGGDLVPGASVDLINASGVIGHHLEPETFAPVLAEIARVLTPDGVAMLDVGPTLAAPVLKSLMAAAHFLCLGHYRSWFADPTGEVVFRRNPR